MGIIKKFSDGSYLEYARGKFDDWCVYLTSSEGNRRPPSDTGYFQQIKTLARKYGAERIYEDYVSIYDQTGKQIDNQVLEHISRIAGGYAPEDALPVDVLFTILYMAMIAEEMKANTRLGRRIKRLGIYYLLYENASVAYAANFMRGMGWRDIARLCEERGF